jgi:hypothetical protein
LNHLRVIDSWTGGATVYHQISYRLVEDEITGETRLEWKQAEENEDCYSQVEKGTHTVARKIAQILLEEDRMRNVVELKRSVRGV